jgi:hypothetical protein
MLGLGKESPLLLLLFLVTRLIFQDFGEYKGIQPHYSHHNCLGIICCTKEY